MEQPSPPVAEDDKATHPENNPPSQLGLCLSTIAIKPLFSDPFLAVYERLANLRKQGRDEDANTMDNSSRVAALCEISGAKQYQKSFNAIWSAKDFREALYHAVAPESGGPPWLRESFKIDAAQEMCMTRIPNVKPFIYPFLFRERAITEPRDRCGKTCSIRPRP